MTLNFRAENKSCQVPEHTLHPGFAWELRLISSLKQGLEALQELKDWRIYKYLEMKTIENKIT